MNSKLRWVRASSLLILALGFGCTQPVDGGNSDLDTTGDSSDAMTNGDGDPTTGDGDPTTGDGDPMTGDGDPGDGDPGDGDPGDGDPGDGDGDMQAPYGPCPGGMDDECLQTEVCLVRDGHHLCTTQCADDSECAVDADDICGIGGGGGLYCAPQACSPQQSCPVGMTCVFSGFAGGFCMWN